VEDNVEAREATDDSIIRRLRFPRWITKATNTRSEYVIIIAFPQQQWLRKRVIVTLYAKLISLVL
jgi:hypothetical protein